VLCWVSARFVAFLGQESAENGTDEDGGDIAGLSPPSQRIVMGAFMAACFWLIGANIATRSRLGVLVALILCAAAAGPRAGGQRGHGRRAGPLILN